MILRPAQHLDEFAWRFFLPGEATEACGFTQRQQSDVVRWRLDDVEVMFDKRQCQARFAGHGIPVPAGLGEVGSFEQLRARMRETGHRRVFVKLAHGSSASGVVAYETNGRRQLATTTVEMVRQQAAGVNAPPEWTWRA